MRARVAVRWSAAAAVALLGAAVPAWAGESPPRPTTRSAPQAQPPRSGPLAPAIPRVGPFDSPWEDREGAYHGRLDGLAWGGHGELRIAEDRVRGVSEPEWFSVGRIGGYISFKPGSRVQFLVEGAWDQGTDDWSMEQLEARFFLGQKLQVHGGIFLVPLGRTNLTHEAPVYEFAERSLPATQIIGVPNPQAGVGIRGAMGAIGGWPLSWEADVVTGFDDGLIMEAEGGTRVPAGRNNYADNNGAPAVVGRLALHPSRKTELGVAAQSGRYNQTVLGGVSIDNPRYVHVVVADGGTALAGFELFSEAAIAIIDVPPGLGTIYAERQWGLSLEATRTLTQPLFGWKRTRLAGGLRFDGVDLDRAILGDSRMRVSTSLNFHRIPIGVVRAGWYYEIERDRFNNETPKAGVTLTAAAYF